MKSQRRFAPKGGRNESESVAGLAGISNSYGQTVMHRIASKFSPTNGECSMGM
jgi:hypothetical protein